MVMAKFTVDTANKLFIAKAGVTEFDVRVDLYSDAKEHWIADNSANKFTFPFIDPATGRTTAQGGPDINPAKGTSIPTYAYLENGWRIRPDEVNHLLTVTGGVVLVQGGGNPFVDTVGAFNVQIQFEQPVQAIGVSSGAVIAPTQQQIRDAATLAPTAVAVANSLDAKVDRNADLIESQRGLHTFQGSIFYVDGVNGNDTTGNGSRALPFKTITKTHTVCTANAHDLIYLLAGVITEPATVVLDKEFVFIRGPGRDVEVKLVGDGDVFDVRATGVELSGLRVTVTGGGKTGIVVSGGPDVVGMRHLWIEDPPQDCIEIKVGTNCIVEHCHLYGAGRSGVRMSSGSGSGFYTRVLNNLIRDCTSNGVDLLGADSSNCHVQDNVIRDNGAGVNVSAGAANTVVTDNRFVNNPGGHILDVGTDTLKEWNIFDQPVRDAMKLAPSAGAPGVGSIDLLATELWQRLGLDGANPLANSPTQITVGGITINVTDVGGVVTLTRA